MQGHDPKIVEAKDKQVSIGQSEQAETKHSNQLVVIPLIIFKFLASSEKDMGGISPNVSEP